LGECKRKEVINISLRNELGEGRRGERNTARERASRACSVRQEPGGVGNESYAKKDDTSLHIVVKYSDRNKIGSVNANRLLSTNEIK
jgi:hypothetical protein